MGNLSFEPEGGGWMEAGWLVIPFDRPVQVAACSIVGLASISTSHARHVSTNPVLEPLANISVRDALGWKEEIRHGPQAARAAGRSDRARGYDTEGDYVLAHVHAVNVKLLTDSKRHVLVAARDSHVLATD